MKIRYLFLVCLSLTLVGCSQKDTEVSSNDEERIIVEKKQFTVSENQSSNDLIADEFIKLYIEQSFEQEALEKKEEDLRILAGDSSLDTALSDLLALKSEVADYQKTKAIRTSASVTLVERVLKSSDVYKKGTLYFADVIYEESSPAFSGNFERRKQYTFKIDNGKVVQFEEVL